MLRTLLPPHIALQAVRSTMLDIDRNLPMVDVTTMEEQISRTLQRERMFATLCNSFGLFALVLSVVGLYGVMAYEHVPGGTARSASAWPSAPCRKTCC